MSETGENGSLGTMVMLPGACCGAWIYNDFRSYFEARGWAVLTPELRHHEKAPGQPVNAGLATTSLTDYVADLTATIEDLPEPPVIMGHSMGGLLAQLLAAKGLARAIALLTPARTWGTLPSSEDEIVAAMGLMSTGPFWTQAMDPVFEIAAENSLNCLSPKRRGEIFAQFVPESGQAI
ncbi:MAG: alpha/beta fold hydrolase, partial [Rhodospirillaceae bacterium]|nr:alpha/beta fold hydrolase [Rhodospirillaceae bacterium]